MRVSIAMATYNGAQYLRAQLQSFVDQTRQPDELIITDDCSTDETETIVSEFAHSAPFRVEFYRNEKNLGYCGNFNAALMKAEGDIVFISDQDDVWFPEKIEHMLGVARRDPHALLVMNDAAITDAELNETGLTKIGQILSAGLSMDKFVMGCCCGIRRELLNLCLPISEGFKSHDNWLVWFADGLSAKVVDTKILQYYRRHETNESQFIANSTVRVSPLHALTDSFNKYSKNKTLDRMSDQVEQLRLFASCVHRVSMSAPEKYGPSLVALEYKTIRKIYTTESRIHIRTKWLLPRVVASLRLWFTGGYRHASGLKSVLRDICG